MSTELAKPKRVARSYTEEEITRALTELALCRGNDRLAAKRLADQGFPVPRSTIQNWGRTRPDDYQRIRTNVVEQVHAQIAQEAEDLASLAAVAERLGIEATITQLATGAKDPSTITRNMATVRGINIDKANLLRGKPTTITEHRHTDQILTSLTTHLHRLTGQTVDTTATEITEHTEPARPVS